MTEFVPDVETENSMAFECYEMMKEGLRLRDPVMVGKASAVMGVLKCDPVFKQLYAIELHTRASFMLTGKRDT